MKLGTWADEKRNSAKLRIPEALAIDIDIAYDNVAVDYHLFFFKGKSSHQMIHGPCSIANCQSNLYSERERDHLGPVLIK